MPGHECYHCKQWVEKGEPHDCWTTTEAALTKDLSEDLRDAWARLRETAVEFGEQRIYASHNSIMFSRKACHFFVRPKRSYLEVFFFLGRPLKVPLVRRVVKSSKVKFAHEIRVTVSGSVALAIAGWYLAAGQTIVSLTALTLGLVVVALLSPQRRHWTAAGFLYAAAAQMASVLVRLDQAHGFVALVFVLLVVWVSDIGGYVAGRGIGGPKLWPRVSPKKTWAGAVGGFAGSLVIAAGFAAFNFGKRCRSKAHSA